MDELKETHLGQKEEGAGQGAQLKYKLEWGGGLERKRGIHEFLKERDREIWKGQVTKPSLQHPRGKRTTGEVTTPIPSEALTSMEQ